ncbi:hypothetical protein HANVADRAFT_24190 [Hanseniaspora valbyensis NRRL Y-1626]|uniref:CS domain-containing protein n=1 Tax=Hanseniaspora valbyensis NRRL Y-1626 TaxID=766949 RepID=A0A1B7TDS6_9ASCO|nr:hypothetical protein HANVADRAFT_24190 [Hanseniaspora valbyensis NRRL Y-1626]
MLTPKFEITQDDAHLFIKIYINNIRFNTGNLDITINKNMMNFTLLPYYLRLRFNEKELLMITQEQPFECRLVTEDDGSECVVVKLFKLERGVFFQDLDNHLTLLSRDNENMNSNNNESMLNIVDNNSDDKVKPLIQEMDDNVNDIEMISKLGDKFDWQIKQTLPKETDSNYKKKIGFSLKHDATAIIPSIYNNNEINDVAEETINKQESQKKFEKELIKLRNYKDNLKFDADYYMNDYITYKYGQTTEMMQEDLEINGILKIIKYVPKDIKQFLQWAKLKQLDKPKFKDTLVYNSFEQEQMREKLPKNIKHDMSQFNQFRNFVFIINVLFGYIYQEMEFDFDLEENTSERSWLIGKLAPQLGNLDQTLILKPDELIKTCLIIAVKKSLSYPLHRNLQLSLKVIDYVNYSLISGSKFIIKLLLKIHELFRYDDVYYIYNKIWFDDLITWLLQFSDTNFHDLENTVVKGDEILDNIFRDMATKVSAISKGFKREDFDFMIIQDELNEQGDNIEWDSLNIAEIENIGDLKFKEFMGNSN